MIFNVLQVVTVLLVTLALVPALAHALELHHASIGCTDGLARKLSSDPAFGRYDSVRLGRLTEPVGILSPRPFCFALDRVRCPWDFLGVNQPEGY